jgi:hypothetical protein
VPGDGDPRHGSTNGYVNLHCRCTDCRKAWAQEYLEARDRRAARLKLDPTLAVHGRASTYTNWKCRCEPCTKANNADKLKREQRKRAKKG